MNNKSMKINLTNQGNYTDNVWPERENCTRNVLKVVRTKPHTTDIMNEPQRTLETGPDTASALGNVCSENDMWFEEETGMNGKVIPPLF
jgi:hypothetical protein